VKDGDCSHEWAALAVVDFGTAALEKIGNPSEVILGRFIDQKRANPARVLK